MADTIVRARFKRRSVWRRDTVLSGAAAGATGGVLMLLFWMGHAALAGAGFAYPLRLIGSMFRSAMDPGVAAGALGLAAHLSFAVGLGVVFAVSTERRMALDTVPAGALLYAVAVLLFMTFGVLPLVNRVLLARVLLSPGAWLLMHALYAAGLTAMPLYRRWMNRSDKPGAAVIPLRRAVV